jgi:hypothetical protein
MWLSRGTTTQTVLPSSIRTAWAQPSAFSGVPEGKTAKNRMHIDIRMAGEPPWDMAEREQLIHAKAAELVTHGATAVREGVLR